MFVDFFLATSLDSLLAMDVAVLGENPCKLPLPERNARGALVRVCDDY
jgi:hypothetical protein